MVRNHVYSNCLVRQILLSSTPLSGYSWSTREKTGRGSRIGNPSKATTLMLSREPAAMVDEFCSASPETAIRLINSRRFVVIRLYRSVLEPASDTSRPRVGLVVVCRQIGSWRRSALREWPVRPAPGSTERED